ncbi:hypothetical protein ABH920_009585 [Catenulispora sp. EB89]
MRIVRLPRIAGALEAKDVRDESAAAAVEH